MKLEWGKKICCPSCSEHFYDMQRQSLVCPYCGDAFSSSALAKKRSAAAAEKIGLADEGLVSFDIDPDADIGSYNPDVVDELGSIRKVETEQEP